MKELQKSERFSVAKKILTIVASLLAGFATGVFGGGGGMIIVPILTGLYGLQPTKAHATAIATIFPLCLVSVIFYLTHGGWQWRSGLVVTAGVIVGGMVGAILMKKIPAKWLQPVFYILMIAGGIKMLTQ